MAHWGQPCDGNVVRALNPSASIVTDPRITAMLDRLQEIEERWQGAKKIINESDQREALSHLHYLVSEAQLVREIIEERDRLREALDAVLALTQPDHTYSTCEPGGTVNADRGCTWCLARQALSEKVES